MGGLGVALSALASLAIPTLSQSAEKPYILGALFPLSGPAAYGGEMYARGAMLALEHLEADKMLRNPVEIRLEDSLGTPQGGAVGMNKLVNVEEAIWVLMSMTGVSKAAAPLGERGKVVMVNGGAVGPDMSGLSPYFFNVLPLLTREIGAAVKWMEKEGYKKLGLIYIDDPAGQGAKRLFEEELPKIGAALVSAYPVATTVQQFGSIAAKFRADGADAVYLMAYGVQLAQMVKQLRENGIDVPLLGTSAVGITPPVLELPESEGLVYTSQVTDWNSDDPVTRRFVEDWRSKYGGDPTFAPLNYYNAVRLFGLVAGALEKTGTPVNGENLRAEILRQRTFQLVGGTGTFDDSGDISLPIQFNRVTGGKTIALGLSESQ
ncbi:ABC transporter substrate-binding protein [Rhodoligotrophos defluvii]|uniref:ABC transporter substrate-binding protein n=1 Tax=Rhodoligotrophos defluvii TaxID=2561934 RepID=UPI0010C97816|nr:ABC transporter substrate-binding protein [Rhodoligotrophos defluvii]